MAKTARGQVVQLVTLICLGLGLMWVPAVQAKEKPMVKLETSMGEIVIELEQDKAPVTTENFLNYVNAGFYNGTIFHRVIKGFMIQGGGFTATMGMKAAKGSIKNEADNGLKNLKYTLAMARTQDPHSASAQFFINGADNDFLDHTGKNPQGWGYAVFGKVVKGTEIVDQIIEVPTGNQGMHQDVPKTPVVIEKATVATE